jgi:hypothetical protein
MDSLGLTTLLEHTPPFQSMTFLGTSETHDLTGCKQPQVTMDNSVKDCYQMLVLITNNKYTHTYMKQGTQGVYTQETPEGENSIKLNHSRVYFYCTIGPFI